MFMRHLFNLLCKISIVRMLFSFFNVLFLAPTPVLIGFFLKFHLRDLLGPAIRNGYFVGQL